jgi:hypothetical protein
LDHFKGKFAKIIQKFVKNFRSGIGAGTVIGIGTRPRTKSPGSGSQHWYRYPKEPILYLLLKLWHLYRPTHILDFKTLRIPALPVRKKYLNFSFFCLNVLIDTASGFLRQEFKEYVMTSDHSHWTLNRFESPSFSFTAT